MGENERRGETVITPILTFPHRRGKELMPGTKFLLQSFLYSTETVSQNQIAALRQYFFRAPLVDRRPVVAENFPKDLVIIGAKPIGQP
jgi:hypothetical protein